VPATGPATNHAAADRCPGVLRLAEAADGYLARIRLPGGLIGAEQMRVLARLAGELGDGRAELTSRGNVQLRGLAADAAVPLAEELALAGLLPSPGHDLVRNVLASPLAGLDGGTDLTTIVQSLDAALCARPRLAELPGRFLFAVDDGRGDVAGLGADVLAQVRADSAVVNGLAVRVAARGGAGDDAAVEDVDALNIGEDSGSGESFVHHRPPNAPTSPNPPRKCCASCTPRLVGPTTDPRATATVMLAYAEAFLDMRAADGGTAWRIADLADGAERVRAAVAARLRLTAAPPAPPIAPPIAPAARPVGVVGPGGTAAVLLAPLGRLTAGQLTWLADRVRGRPARITPWRSVVLPDLADAAGLIRDAAGLGFGVDAASPWLRVTACAGRPRCASALADVQADAAAFAARWPDRIVHVSGCGRHCGRPAATQVDVTATSEGYHVAGV
jgi:precorrin-3B synthase